MSGEVGGGECFGALSLSEAVRAVYIERNIGLSYYIDDGRNK